VIRADRGVVDLDVGIGMAADGYGACIEFYFVDDHVVNHLSE
jgi:hypothetical protein